MRRPGPTPDTTVESVEFDGSHYLVVFGDDDAPQAIRQKVTKGPQKIFVSYRTTWEEGQPLSSRFETILALTSQPAERQRD